MQGFVPDTRELGDTFTGRMYNSRIKAAQAHGIPIDSLRNSYIKKNAPASYLMPGAQALSDLMQTTFQ